MKFVSNAGSDRVLDLIRPWLKPEHRMDMVSPSFSLYAFSEVLTELPHLSNARLVVPPTSTAPAKGMEQEQLGLLGTAADRASRNKLQVPWLAKKLAAWLESKADVRHASGPIPQGTLVLRDDKGSAQQAALGSFSFSSEGLGVTPGNPVKGDYALMFEEEYKRWARHPDYQSLFAEVDLSMAAHEVHNGYFSIDKKKIGGKTVEMVKDTSGSTAADDDTYNLIMRDKEKLLSFESPLKFIFSHSALKEGWDNPNVFQICNFSTRETERWRRQTIGRGLRLCVNQKGERLRGFEVNTLTVIATESYEQFAENLQKDIEKDTGILFGVVQDHEFAGIAVVQAAGDVQPMGFEASKTLWAHLKAQGYINDKGKVQDTLKTALKDGTLSLPNEFEAQRQQVVAVLKKLSGKLEVKNADDRKQIAVRKSVLISPEFRALWDRIKHKTTYRVQFDNEKLIERCIEALNDAPPVAKTRLQWKKAGMAINKAGVDASLLSVSDSITLNEGDIELPDVLTELQDRTHLTRKTIARILTESTRLNDFKRNPQQFIELAADAINRCKRLALVDGIKYQRLGDEHFYAQELFETEELTGYLKNLVQDTTKSVYEHVVYDSTVERDFAEALERNEAIKVYAKLPGWFKVPTPLGTYNPDWAVLVERDGQERLYFVVETKSSLFDDDLRDLESGKIKCGAAHFKALAVGENPAIYGKFRDLDGVLAHHERTLE